MSDKLDLRIAALPWVAASSTGETPGTPILAISNQILVDAAHDAAVMALPASKLLDWTLLTTLFQGLPGPHFGAADVNVYQVSGGHDIFELIDTLRAELVAANHDFPQAIHWVPPSAVSPNHILIPAPLGGSCPHGGPFPAPGGWGLQAPDPNLPRPRVTVIDTGWQWNPAWDPYGNAQNLLHEHVSVIHAAERLPMLAELPPGVGGGAWMAGAPEPAGEQLPDGHLLALAGHANFIAGVIARHSSQADITIVNHSSRFLTNPRRLRDYPPAEDPPSDSGYYDFPSEVAVARSLCKSMSVADGAPQVIDLGFCFLPWTSGITDAAFAATDDVVSAVWDHTFHYLATRHHAPVVVVAPAGNQDSSLRRYPAALPAKDPQLFANVIGVASIDDPAPPAYPLLPEYKPTLSADFTNHGTEDNAWVTCSAIGSNVTSTFLFLDTKVEEWDDPTDVPYRQPDVVYDFTATNSWAVWNGTSFATPKVVAGIANKLVDGALDGSTAWGELAETGIVAGDPAVAARGGIQFPDLG